MCHEVDHRTSMSPATAFSHIAINSSLSGQFGEKKTRQSDNSATLTKHSSKPKAGAPDNAKLPTLQKNIVYFSNELWPQSSLSTFVCMNLSLTTHLTRHPNLNLRYIKSAAPGRSIHLFVLHQNILQSRCAFSKLRTMTKA